MQRPEQQPRAVVGRYRVAETQMTVISVGTRVDLRQEDGSTKGYLLLRVTSRWRA